MACLKLRFFRDKETNKFLISKKAEFVPTIFENKVGFYLPFCRMSLVSDFAVCTDEEHLFEIIQSAAFVDGITHGKSLYRNEVELLFKSMLPNV